DVILIAVGDQGAGIAEDDTERIFERFYRVDSARSRATGGTGLGLSIVKHTIYNHGGAIMREATAREGRTFIIRLPELDPQAHAATTEGTEPNPQNVKHDSHAHTPEEGKGQH